METSGLDLHFGSGHVARSSLSANIFLSSVRNLVNSNAVAFVYVISGLRPKPDPYQKIGLDLKFPILAS